MTSSCKVHVSAPCNILVEAGYRQVPCIQHFYTYMNVRPEEMPHQTCILVPCISTNVSTGIRCHVCPASSAKRICSPTHTHTQAQGKAREVQARRVSNCFAKPIPALDLCSRRFLRARNPDVITYLSSIARDCFTRLLYTPRRNVFCVTENGSVSKCFRDHSTSCVAIFLHLQSSVAME